MKHIASLFTLIAFALALSLSAYAKGIVPGNNNHFPKFKSGGKIAIVAHRGFWNCEEAGFSENSIASLKAAQNAGLWGSEVDIRLTKDDRILVNHDDAIEGKKVSDHNLAEFDKCLLPNGEKRPTLDEYLEQARKSKTVLVIEFKASKYEAKADLLVDKTIEALKAHKLFNPRRVAFISFNLHVCERIAQKCPAFVNQYLSGNKEPSELAAMGINGIDYQYKKVLGNQKMMDDCRACKMSFNVWTVDKKENIETLIGQGVDQITTNKPLLVRSLLGDREYK